MSNFLHTTPEAIREESLKIELGQAKTKIADLDTQLKDYKITNKLLSERLRSFELAKENETFQQYFPSSSMSNAPAASISKSISDFNRSTVDVINVFKTEVLKCVSELALQITKLESVLKTTQSNSYQITDDTSERSLSSNTEDTPVESFAINNEQIHLNM